MNHEKVTLTGIKPTGSPHLGNYLGAIAPALELAQNFQAYYFIADYHALTTLHDRERLRRSVYSVAATFLALGLDPAKAVFYRQSDVPEIFELAWILSCFTPKGFMNRAHAYKDKVARNMQEGVDPDAGVNMGLFSYPNLMNADILLFGAQVVPVGKDQKQHVEFARDVALRFNKHYGKECFVIPEPIIREETDVITGLDGRKMSKSYDNTIEIFLPSKKLRKVVNSIVTNSQAVEEPKSTQDCNVYAIYRHFATEEQKVAINERYAQGGMGWGDAKKALFELLEQHFGSAREKYDALMAHPAEVEVVLQEGAKRARIVATQRLNAVKDAIGLKF
jgi:tryptophanyl-tRNA synthetase